MGREREVTACAIVNQFKHWLLLGEQDSVRPAGQFNTSIKFFFTKCVVRGWWELKLALLHSLEEQVTHAKAVELVELNATAVVARAKAEVDCVFVFLLGMQLEVQATEVHFGILAGDIILSVLGATILLEGALGDDLQLRVSCVSVGLSSSLI